MTTAERVVDFFTSRPPTETLEVPLTQQKIPLDVLVDRNNPVAGLIETEIQHSPSRKIPFSYLMQLSLYGEGGYYSSASVDIGNRENEGHFATSPEASDFFGAGIGKALVKAWEAMGRPPKFQVVEMGAGKGGLAFAFLDWTRAVYPEFYSSLRYIILEYGKGLVPAQRARLRSFETKVDWVVGSAYELPFAGVEGAFISNELLDAFAVERVTKVGGELRQKYVTIEQDEWIEIWDEPSEAVAEHIAKYGIEVREGVEEPVSLYAEQFQRQVNESLKRGLVLTIDYGLHGPVGKKGSPAVRFKFGMDIWRSVFNLSYLQAAYLFPGKVDITASVNFGILGKIAEEDGLTVVFEGQQGEFFQGLNISDMIFQMRQLKIRSPILELITRPFLGFSPGVEAYQDCVLGEHGDHFVQIFSKNVEISDAFPKPSNTDQERKRI